MQVIVAKYVCQDWVALSLGKVGEATSFSTDSESDKGNSSWEIIGLVGG